MTARPRRVAREGTTTLSRTARDVFERLAQEQRRTPGVQRKRMFGHDGLNLDGRYYAFLDGDCLAVKLSRDDVASLVLADDVISAERVSPSMRRTWTCVPLSAEHGGEERWVALMAEARGRVQA